MSDKVLEAKVTDGELTMHLDPESGGNLHQVIKDALEDCDGVRHVDGFEIDEAYTMEGY